MEKLPKKPKHILVRGLLMIATLCLVLLIMLQVTLFIGINALNTGKAHDYIQAQVTTAMAASGYNAIFDKLYYDPVRGFTLRNLTILDKDGTIATADRFLVDIAFSKIPLRELNIVASGGTVHLVRLPDAQNEEVAALQPFELPNVYFKTFKIFRMNIDSLNIGASVAGQDLSFSPSLKANMKIGSELTVEASLLPKSSTELGGVPLPETIDIAGGFTPSTLSFVLKNLSIVSPDYKINGAGSGQLTESGQIDAHLSADYPDLKTLTQGNFASAKLSFEMGGVYSQPTFHMEGTIVPALLKEKGLSDITISANADDAMKGNVSIKTSYLKEPLSLDTMLSYDVDILTLKSIKGTAPLIAMDGSGSFSLQDNKFDGQILVTASDLAYYQDLLSADISGALNIDAGFKIAENIQKLNVVATATQLRFEDIQLDKAQVVIKDVGGGTYNLFVDGGGAVPFPVAFKGSVNLSHLTGDFPTLSNIDVVATLGKSVVSLTGALDTNAADLKLNTKNFRGVDIPLGLGDGFEKLRINGDVILSGNLAAPVTKAKIAVGGVHKNLAITMDANHQDGKANLSLSGKGSGIKILKGETAFPLHFALFPLAFDMDMNAPLLGNVVADIDMGAISTLFLPPTQEFSAGLKANANLGGTIAKPDVSGQIKLQNGKFTDDQNGIRLRAINVNSSFTKDSMAVESITATDGEMGRMSGQGHVDLSGGTDTDLSLKLAKFHLPASNLANGMLDANFSFVGGDTGYELGGTVDIERMNIMIPDTFQSKIPELNIVERKKQNAANAQAQNISLAVKVNAPNQIFVRGWGLDAEFGGELDITGDAASPIFNGNLASKRGRYEEFGKRFTLARANLRFQGELPPSPYLDIEATTPADDVTASILLEGPVKEPKITFSSTPALPQDEVLSRLLFGRDTAKITPFQAVQLAQALRRFSGEGGGGGLNPLEMLRSATGLDDISIDTDAKGESNVGVGKYLTDKVYLEFEKGKAQGSGAANIQIELTPNINLQSEIGQDAQAGGGVFWKKDY